MKPFDDKFADNVREVFDNYQEPADEQAWLQMKSRLQGKQRTKKLFPLYFLRAAAVILLLLVPAFLWMYRPHSESAIQLAEEVKHRETDNVDAIVFQGETMSHEQAGKDDSKGSEKQLPSSGSADYTEPNKPVTQQKEDESYPVSSENIARDVPEYTPKEATHNDLIAGDLEVEKETPSEEVVSTSEEISAPGQPVYKEEDIIRDNLAWQQASATRESHIEVAAGSMKTWSPDEVAGGVGFSAGVARLWDLGSNFSFSGGGALVYNRINLTNTPFFSYTRGEMDYNAPISLDGAETFLVMDKQVATDMEFLAVDFPLNFRYRVLETSNKTIYVSAGVSSFLYLQQSYTQQTEYLAEYTHADFAGVRTTTVETTVREDIGPFGRFDLARFLNISAGYGIQRRNFSFVIEPYVKLPVTDVTSLNMSIGMAGVSLKYKFEQ